jgi:hypothetical protein
LPTRRHISKRRLAAEAAIVAVAALSAFVAHASLPTPSGAPAPTAAALAPPPPPALRDDQMLIAFVEPVPGHAVVSPFGLRQLPWEGAGRLHEGVDISADAGVPVVAAAEGVVIEAGTKGGYGRYVALRHAEGLVTVYAHLGEIGADIETGAEVATGQPIGKIGSTGVSTGPHLHFEIRDAQDRPLNPALFLGRAFAEAGDLPLDLAKRYSGRVRMAVVSRIPESKRALMTGRSDPDTIIVRRKTTDAQDLAAAERNLEGQARAAAKAENIDGLRALAIGPDGRPRAQLAM